MAKTKTSKKQKRSSRKLKDNSFNIESLAPVTLTKGVKLDEHNPDLFLKNTKAIRAALTEAFFDGDVDGFKEILAAHLRALSKDVIAKKTGVSRATVFRILDRKSNPSFENVLKVIKTLKIAS